MYFFYRDHPEIMLALGWLGVAVTLALGIAALRSGMRGYGAWLVIGAVVLAVPLVVAAY